MDRRTRKQIEWAFYNYEANKKLGAEQIAEVAEQGLTADLDKIGFGGGVSNPTESKALYLVDRLKPYFWAKVVENTLSAFRFEAAHEILYQRYFMRKSHRALIERYFGSERSYYYTLDRALEYAYMWALEYGIIT